jgi:hypothetical protein
VLLFCSLLVAPYVLEAGLQSKTNYVPPDGFVPDSRAAIGVGEAVLIAVYGEDRIRSEEPFSADLSGVSGLSMEHSQSLTMRVELQKSVSRNRRVVFST